MRILRLRTAPGRLRPLESSLTMKKSFRNVKVLLLIVCLLIQCSKASRFQRFSFCRTALIVRGGQQSSSGNEEDLMSSDTDADDLTDLGEYDEEPETVSAPENEEEEEWEDAVQELAPEETQTESIAMEQDDQETASFATEDDPSIVDEDSSANVDRMEYADAYDEGELTEVDSQTSSSSSSSSATASSTTTSTASASVTTVQEINRDMRTILIQTLKYRKHEVKNMRPAIAAIVVQKKLERPDEGIPPNWYIAGKQPSQGGIAKVLPKIVVPVVAAGLAIAAGKELDFDFTWPPKMPSLSAPSKPAVEAAAETAKTSSQADTAPAYPAKEEEPKKEEDDDLIPYNEHVTRLGKEHPHSIKPSRPSVNDELDVTWLDKAITAVEKRIKKILRIQI